jgi:hypothetical protein
MNFKQFVDKFSKVKKEKDIKKEKARNIKNVIDVVQNGNTSTPYTDCKGI